MGSKEGNSNTVVNNDSAGNNSAKQTNDSVISIFTLLLKLKKYLILWVAFAVLSAFISLGVSLIVTYAKKPELTALISFSYDGIEQGLDPNGRKFDVNTVKSPAVIEMALTELNIDIKELESVRDAISFKKIMPQDAYDKFTVYNSILNNSNSGSIEAAEKVLETSYFPTQFTVVYNSSKTSLSSDQDVDVFNKVLEKYDEYFYKTYGYNESFGNALSAVSYTDYDYSEAVDVFSTSLKLLGNYVKNLADEDDTHFRSSITGYTLNDLYASIGTVQSIDLDNLSSYITFHKLTKDKQQAISYYDYRIQELTRQMAAYQEQIENYDKSIASYEKDQMLVFGGEGQTNVQSMVASDQYDKMFSQKNSALSEISVIKQDIAYYTQKKKDFETGGSALDADMKKVEANLAALSEKVNNLNDLVSDTTEDYYKNVVFCNAYNILVPASNSLGSKLSIVVGNLKMPLIVIELFGIVAYVAAAYIDALLSEKNKGK